MESISKTYCPLPWIHVCTNPSGRLTLCCEDTLESDYEGQRAYHLLTSLDEFRESPYLRWVRGKMIRGETLRECAVCEAEGARGLPSKRRYELQQWGPVENDSAVLYADLKLGNHCNLCCFMCDPNSSSRIASEFRDLHWDKNPPFLKGQMGIPVERIFHENWHWPSDLRLRSVLNRILPGLKKLKITGGEPLINPRVLSLLRELSDAKAKIPVVQITTNATMIDDEVISLMHGLKADLVVSLEGIEKVNDFVRYPSCWESIANTIVRLKAGQVSVRINATVNCLNVLTLPDLIEYNHATLPGKLTLMPVTFPQIFDPSILPAAVKNSVAERLVEWRDKTAVPDADHYCRQILNRLHSKNHDPALFGQFTSYIIALCKHRTLNIGSYLPDFAALVNLRTD